MCGCVFTCWSTPTASRPSYMMLTQPSLQDSTNRAISACKKNTEMSCYHNTLNHLTAFLVARSKLSV